MVIFIPNPFSFPLSQLANWVKKYPAGPEVILAIRISVLNSDGDPQLNKSPCQPLQVQATTWMGNLYSTRSHVGCYKPRPQSRQKSLYQPQVTQVRRPERKQKTRNKANIQQRKPKKLVNQTQNHILPIHLDTSIRTESATAMAINHQQSHILKHGKYNKKSLKQTL